MVYINQIYFDSFGCGPPNKLSTFIMKQNGYSLSSEYKIQGLTSNRDSFSAAYCAYVIYLTKVLGIDFKSVVLKRYDQRLCLNKWRYGKLLLTIVLDRSTKISTCIANQHHNSQTGDRIKLLILLKFHKRFKKLLRIQELKDLKWLNDRPTSCYF